MLLLLACAACAEAASFTLTYEATIDSIYDRNSSAITITTAYGDINSGDTISIQVAYDLATFTRTSPPGTGGGNVVTYSSTAPTVATIGTSSGYSFSGPVSNANAEVVSFVNQSPGTVVFHGLAAAFMTFSDDSGVTFTTDPLESDSLEAIHSAFVTSINSGWMVGAPVESYLDYGIPGLTGRDIGINFSAPSVLTLTPTAVPEPSSLLWVTAGLLPVVRHRRKIA